MIIASPVKQYRPIKDEHVEPYKKIERLIMESFSDRSFTESELSQAVDVDKEIVRKCIYRLNKLGALKEVDRVSKGRGRPARLWSR